MTARELLIKFWSDAWSEGLWAASWSKSVEGLTAAQAAWSPPNASGVPGQRHSIHQIVLHMVFWREDALRRIAAAPGAVPKPTPEQLARDNFPTITDLSERAWSESRRRLADSQQAVAAALASPSASADRLQYLLPHDSYHFGQINYIRSMLGLAPIE
jgi:uncharacterized damage-inducible protein DinB